MYTNNAKDVIVCHQCCDPIDVVKQYLCDNAQKREKKIKGIRSLLVYMQLAQYMFSLISHRYKMEKYLSIDDY